MGGGRQFPLTVGNPPTGLAHELQTKALTHTSL